MFKCNSGKLLNSFLLLLFLSSCVQKNVKDIVFIDVQKTCGENPKLVEKIMHFSKGHFEIAAQTDPKWGTEQTWDLKKYIARQYGLEWFQIKFERNQLQSVWLGPRSDFASDMKQLGVRLYFIKGPKGESIDNYEGGTYTLLDLANRPLRVEHSGAPVKGTMVTCFKPGNP